MDALERAKGGGGEGEGGKKKGNEDREGGEKGEEWKEQMEHNGRSVDLPKLEQGNDAMFVKQLLRLSARIPD